MVKVNPELRNSVQVTLEVEETRHLQRQRSEKISKDVSRRLHSGQELAQGTLDYWTNVFVDDHREQDFQLFSGRPRRLETRSGSQEAEALLRQQEDKGDDVGRKESRLLRIVVDG